MTDKTMAFDSQGNAKKMPGWFSWRHQTREAHDEAHKNYGGTRVQRQKRKRIEAEVRNESTPVERTAAFRRQQVAA